MSEHPHAGYFYLWPSRCAGAVVNPALEGIHTYFRTVCVISWGRKTSNITTRLPRALSRASSSLLSHLGTQHYSMGAFHTQRPTPPLLYLLAQPVDLLSPQHTYSLRCLVLLLPGGRLTANTRSRRQLRNQSSWLLLGKGKKFEKRHLQVRHPWAPSECS